MKNAWIAWLATIVFALVGLGLTADSAMRSSATYDEVLYLKVGASWWRTGDQDAITRVGSPSLFWKLQQTIPLWCLDRAGHGAWIDEPERFQSHLLPIIRLGSLPIWLIAFATTAAWARLLHGPNAMAFASAVFGLSPNLLAHAPLVTMEMPLVACSAGIFLSFWLFLESGKSRYLCTCAIVAGIAFSCKYTVVLIPPILGVLWWLDLRTGFATIFSKLKQLALGAIAFTAIMAATNLVVTGFSTLPISPNSGTHHSVEGRFAPFAARILEMPVPRELAGFAVQSRLQRQGGSSYLLGERREHGWWWYYFVALGVKATPAFLLMFAARIAMAFASPSSRKTAMMPQAIAIFLILTALGSTRNFGVRYLLLMSPVAIVWISGLAAGGRVWKFIAVAGVIGQAGAVATSHPHELSYFPLWVNGHHGGRFILADSNLDWGQGLKGLASLQNAHPHYRDLTLYYFGDTEPRFYGVSGTSFVINAGNHHPELPAEFRATTRYVGVSTSLSHGPWGPSGYFSVLDRVEPIHTLDDGTIAIYRVSDVQ